MTTALQQTPPRIDFFHDEGFLLYNDVNNQVMAEQEAMLLEPLEDFPKFKKMGMYLDGRYDLRSDTGESNKKIIEENPAGASLFLAMQQVSKGLPDVNGQDFYQHYGVNEEDKRAADEAGALKHGFGDMKFPWNFAAGLANGVADFFVEQGVLSQEQQDNFTLHDWANIIGTGWFSHLAHMMAKTSNGTYRVFGDKFGQYGKGALAQAMHDEGVVSPGTPLFEYEEQAEEYDGHTYATAQLTRDYNRALRARMAKETIGCPVAHFTVKLSTDQYETNPHAQNLTSDGTLRVDKERSDNEWVRLTQEWSAIDKALALLATQLDRYEDQFGTPRMVYGFYPGQSDELDVIPDPSIAQSMGVQDYGGYKVEHRFGPPIEALRWKDDAESPRQRDGAAKSLGALAAGL